MEEYVEIHFLTRLTNNVTTETPTTQTVVVTRVVTTKHQRVRSLLPLVRSTLDRQIRLLSLQIPVGLASLRSTLATAIPSLLLRSIPDSSSIRLAMSVVPTRSRSLSTMRSLVDPR